MATEESKMEVLAEIQPVSPPNVIITRPTETNSNSSTSSEPEEERGYLDSNGSLIESHSENEFTKASTSPYEAPDDELKEKIRLQVEYYMSDENLGKDAFLLKHVRRHKEGFVNLKLITSFKKVKNLTKDYRVVAESLTDSKLLVMNAEETKVRRVNGLPTELGERNPGRTIVATNLPVSEPSIEKVAEIFSKYGPIAVVRIIRGAKNVPPECKTHFVCHPELADQVCAIVEFETMAAAARSCSELKDSEITVTELVRSPSKSSKGKKDKENQPNGIDSDQLKDSEGGESKGKRRRKKKKDKNALNKDKRLNELLKESGDESPSSSSDNENAYSSFKSYRRRYNLQDPQSPKSRRANKSNPGSSSPATSPETRRRTPELWRQSPGHSSDGGSPTRSPIMQRRLAGQGTSPLAAHANHRMIQVLRQPKGPDGTRGFAGRGQVVVGVRA